MPPEGRFTKPTTQNAVFSDDFNDRIITNATCVREALIEVDLISASLIILCVRMRILCLPRLSYRIHAATVLSRLP